ncbi:O-antigen polymerase [Iodobacter arcticus]|uniref:O-antigen polymerase n=1 Tax=Iodobacter arcticus TaxID=590593 RepID=A0ABW2QW91_9NEIS
MRLSKNAHAKNNYKIIPLIGMFLLCILMTYSLFIGFANEDKTWQVYSLNLFILLIFVVWTMLYSSFSMFFMSSSFWMAVTILFYFVLKSIEQVNFQGRDDLLMPLFAVIVFVFFYTIGYFITPGMRLNKNINVKINWSKMYLYCLISFFVLKGASFLAFALLSSGAETALEVIAETQNMGMAYLFRIFMVSNVAFYILLFRYYSSGEFKRTVLILTLCMFVDLVLNASRSGIILLFFVHLYFRHKYIKPVPIGLLFCLFPILVFVVSFFGYVRDIGIGNLSVYWDAFKMMSDDIDIVFVLFMARMDVLPLVADAMKLYAKGDIHTLWGGSYIYSFMHFIPRGLWLDKPPLTAAYVTSIVRPELFADGVNIYPSIILEAFINFIWIGVGIVGLIVGFFCKKFDDFFNSGNVLYVVWCMFFFTFPMGLVNEGLHSNYFANMIYLSFIMYLFFIGAKKVNAIKIIKV